MIKKIFGALLLIALTGAASAAELKVGVVDLRTIVAKSPQREAIAEKIKKQYADKVDELKKLAEKQQKLAEKINRDKMTMTEEQKIKAEREWKELDADIKLKNNALQEDSQRSQKAELDKVLVKIQKAIEKVAKEGQYDLILRREATLYSGPTVNISDKILTIISNPAG